MFDVLDIRDFNLNADWNYIGLPKYVANRSLNCQMRHIFILFIFNKLLFKYGYDGKILIGLPNIPIVYVNNSNLVFYTSFIYMDESSSILYKFRTHLLNFKNNKHALTKYSTAIHGYKSIDKFNNSDNEFSFPFPYIRKLNFNNNLILACKFICDEHFNEEVRNHNIKDLKGNRQRNIILNLYLINDYKVLLTLFPCNNFIKPLYQNIINIRPIYTIQNFNIVE